MENDDRNAQIVPFRFGTDMMEECQNEEGSDSSDDELDIILHGTPEQQRKLSRSLSRGSLQMSSSEDEFEKEMESELDATMKRHERRFIVDVQSRLSLEAGSTQSVQPSTSTAEQRSVSQQFYDDVYFDSDDEEEERKTSVQKAENKDQQGENSERETSKDSNRKHRIPTNDDLLYDPNIDDDNQTWMDKQRAQYYPKKGSKQPKSKDTPAKKSDSGTTSQQTQNSDKAKATNSDQSAPKTDAVLNCPACMSTLCIDCQRHDLYANQYRAMFVMNCCIVRSERLRYPASSKKRRRKKRKHERENEEGDGGEGCSEGDELYHPVKCSICNTEVAVLDNDDIYHFFNVLSSAA